MKRKILNILLILILVLTIPGTMVLASDVSGALYKMVVQVSNNGTLANYVATNSTGISTPNLIAGGFLSSAANECAVLDAADNDVAFMPGYSTNPWCFWVETIGADSYINYDLYTANSTGGHIAYFPGDGGMTVADDASIEPANNFEFDIDGWLNTSDSNFIHLMQKRHSVGVSVTDTDEVSGVVYYDEPAELIPAAYNAWTDVDVSEYVPEMATGIVLQLYTSNPPERIGARINGSADDLSGDQQGVTWAMAGIDATDMVELFLETATCHIYLVGFTGADFTFKTAADDVSLGAALAWTDIDISTEAPGSTGAVIFIDNTDAVNPRNVGLREDTSADNRTNPIFQDGGLWGFVGVSGTQVLEGYIQALTVDFYLVGYTTANVTWETTGIDKSLGAGFGAWTDVDCSGDVPVGTTHIIFEVISVGGTNYGFRRNGSTQNIVALADDHAWTVVECDEDRIVEHWAQNGNLDIFIVGYTSGYIDSPYQGEVIASALTSGEYALDFSLNANQYDFSDYDTYTTVAVNMGGGLMPVVLLDEEELTAPAASVTFSNIDTLVSDWDAIAGVTSRHLVVVINAATDGAVGYRDIRIRLNGDAGANYNHQNMMGINAVASATRTTAGTYLALYGINGTTYANSFSGVTALFPAAFLTNNHKACISYGGAVEELVGAVAGRWADADAIDSIEIFTHAADDYVTGSTFWLGVVDERYLVEEDYNAGADFLPDFNNIPQDGSDLCVIGYLRSDVAAGDDWYYHELNNDAVVANYHRQYLFGRGAVTAANSAATNQFMITTGDNATANAFGCFMDYYSQYAESTNQVHYLSLNGYHNTAIPDSFVVASSGRWANANAITKIEYFPAAGANFKAGSLFSLYRVPRYVIDRQELTAPAATITFTDIPQGYEALQINIYTRTTRAAVNDDVDISFNNDVVAANYDIQRLYGQGAVVNAARAAAGQYWVSCPANAAGANEFSGGIITIPNYAKSDRHKHAFAICGINEDYVFLNSCRWEDTDPITEIDLTPAIGPNFMAGTIVELVGIFPQDVMAIAVDGDLYGIADGNNIDTPDMATDYIYCADESVMYLNSAEASGAGLWFAGGACDIDFGVMHGGEPDFWISYWFKLDSDFSSDNTANFDLWSLAFDGTNEIHSWLDQVSGSMYILQQTAAVVDFSMVSTTTYWHRNTWYHVLISISDSGGGTQRFLVNGSLEDSDTQASNPTATGCDFTFGSAWGGGGVIGVLANCALGTDELTTVEEAGLYAGTIPSDANNIWYMDEGTGNVVTDYGTDGVNGATHANNVWVGSGTIKRGAWEWEYDTIFHDTASVGVANDATPTFRTASSDVDVIATAISFQPVEEAKAPPYTLDTSTATWVTAANVTGNFTTTPSPTFPGHTLIEAIATATGTPAQLPFTMIFGFVILAISLSVSSVMRNNSSRSLFVKSFIIGSLMGIAVAVRAFDFWMIVFFIIIAAAVMAASKPGDVT